MVLDGDIAKYEAKIEANEKALAEESDPLKIARISDALTFNRGFLLRLQAERNSSAPPASTQGKHTLPSPCCFYPPPPVATPALVFVCLKCHALEFLSREHLFNFM